MSKSLITKNKVLNKTTKVNCEKFVQQQIITHNEQNKKATFVLLIQLKLNLTVVSEKKK